MKPRYDSGDVVIYHGNAEALLPSMPAESVNCCVTSPPYWGLRDYGVDGQIGLEKTPEEYVAKIVGVFEHVRRVLRADGTVWLNLGDSYANDHKWGGATGGKHAAALHGSQIGRAKRNTGLKEKDMIGIPWRVAFALQAAGWWLRSDIIWAKPTPMPESVTDRPTRSHEHIFLLAKSERYYYDADAIAEKCSIESLSRAERNRTPNPDRAAAQRGNPSGPDRGEGPIRSGLTRNKRDVWNVPNPGYPEAHFATFPPALILPCILAGCPPGGTVLDPFMGAGTTALVAKENGRRSIGIEINADYIGLAAQRLRQDVLTLGEEAGDGPRRGRSQSREENECLTT